MNSLKVASAECNEPITYRKMIKKIIMFMMIIGISLGTANAGTISDRGYYDVNTWDSLVSYVDSGDYDVVTLKAGQLFNQNVSNRIDFTRDIIIEGNGATLNLSPSCSSGVFTSSTSGLSVTVKDLTIIGNECTTDIFQLGSVTFEEFNFLRNTLTDLPQQAIVIDAKTSKFEGNYFLNVNKGVSVDLDSVDGMNTTFKHNVFTNEEYYTGSEFEAIEINPHRDSTGYARVESNYISGFLENSIDFNIGRGIITNNIIYGNCSETSVASLIVSAADTSNFSDVTISNNNLYDVPANQKGIQLIGYSSSNDSRTVTGNKIFSCEGIGSSSQYGITSSSNINDAVISGNQIHDLYNGFQVYSDDITITDNVVTGYTNYFETEANIYDNFVFDSVYKILGGIVRFLDSEANPVRFCRNDNTCDTEYAEVYVSDSEMIFVSEQDETSGTYGGFNFKFDNDGTVIPRFLIETKTGSDIFEVQKDGDIYTEGTLAYTGSCGSSTTLTVKNGLITGVAKMKKIIISLLILFSLTLVNAGTLTDTDSVIKYDNVPICLTDGSQDFTDRVDFKNSVTVFGNASNTTGLIRLDSNSGSMPAVYFKGMENSRASIYTSSGSDREIIFENFGAGEFTPVMSNFLIGNTNGTYDETSPERPFTNNQANTYTVCSSGCDYTTFKEAANQIPLYARFLTTINLKNGNYGDLIIPPVINARMHGTEGNIIAVSISGNSSSLNSVTVDSIIVESVTGTHAVEIKHLNVDSCDPYSDEDNAISIYGSNSVILHDLNITGSCTNGVMAYSSNVYLSDDITFNGQTYGTLSKNFGSVQLGDSTGGSSIGGSVTGTLVKTGKSSQTTIHDNTVSYPNLISTVSTGITYDEVNEIIYSGQDPLVKLDVSNTGKIGFGVTPTEIIHIEEATDDGLKIKTTGTTNKAIDVYDNTVRTGSRLVHIKMDNSASTGNLLELQNDGDGATLKLIAGTTDFFCDSNTRGAIEYNGSHYLGVLLQVR